MAQTGGTNPYEEGWVQQAMASSLLPGSAAGPAVGRDDTLADEELQRALRESANDAPASQEDLELQQALKASVDDDADLQRALRESVERTESRSVRRLMGPEGPFFPAGIVNSGNSCFWNALLQVLCAATPIFRGALFQQALDGYPEGGRRESKDGGAIETPSTTAILGLLRDLFAEMDMGLVDAIDAGELYRMIFQRAEEADVNEQTQRLFELLSQGPGPVKAVFSELFSGELYEHLREGSIRSVAIDFCRLDLCVTQPTSLEVALEEHTRDVQGSIVGRSYRLPPVLWLNLDRFVYDREAQTGKKLNVPLTFPDVLNAWMLVPPDAAWAARLRESGKRRAELTEALRANRQAVAKNSPTPAEGAELAPDHEETLVRLVERQEALASELAKVEEVMLQQGQEQELLYQLQAVIVHRGRVDTGHYFAYTRSPCSSGSPWLCLNDSTVTLCSVEEMRGTCEGCRSDGGDSIQSPTQKLPAVDTVAQCKADTNAPAQEPQITASPSPCVPTTPISPEPGAPPPANGTPSMPNPDISPSSPSIAPGARPKVVANAKSPTKPPSKRQSVFSSVSSMFGCLQKPAVNGRCSGETEYINSDSPESYPPTPSASSTAPAERSTSRQAAIAQPKSMLEESSLYTPPSVDPLAPTALSAVEVPEEGCGANHSALVPDSSDTPLLCTARAPTRDPEAQTDTSLLPASPPPLSKKTGDVTAARCLVYVRSCAGGDQLLGEVKRRVPPALQESIDARNLELLRKNIDTISDDFVRCMRDFNAGPHNSDSQSDQNCIAVELLEALDVAVKIRTEGGMGRARIYLLRECWRRHVPWLPEDLSPTTTPPDFRMYYGSACKTMLLDALIQRGQHDVASLIVAETKDSDAFISEQAKAWFVSHHF